MYVRILVSSVWNMKWNMYIQNNTWTVSIRHKVSSARAPTHTPHTKHMAHTLVDIIEISRWGIVSHTSKGSHVICVTWFDNKDRKLVRPAFIVKTSSCFTDVDTFTPYIFTAEKRKWSELFLSPSNSSSMVKCTWSHSTDRDFLSRKQISVFRTPTLNMGLKTIVTFYVPKDKAITEMDAIWWQRWHKQQNDNIFKDD